MIVDTVATQLIGEGFWEWAVYASLCFIGSGTMSESSASSRQLRAKNIISRFYAPSTDPSAGSRRSFLENIGVPPQWFVEAHAHRCQSEGDVFGMVDNLMQYSAVDSMAAMECLMIPHMILEGKGPMKQLWQLLEALRSKISDDCMDSWNKPNGCGTFLKYLWLRNKVEQLAQMSLEESSNVDIDHLLDMATNLEMTISKIENNAPNNSSLSFAKVRYGFTRVPQSIVVEEVGAVLSNLRMQLLAIKSGQPAHDSHNDPHRSLKCSSRLAFALAPDGLYDSFTSGDESVLRGFCGFRAMG